MSDLINLVYASRATFAANRNNVGIEPNVARILAQSSKNNPKNEIGGVLYYGDGHFFQCLEGEREVVEASFEKLRADPRHTDVKVLAEYTVERRSFADWSMKYVAVERSVTDLLAQHDMTSFDPYRFDGRMVFDMMVLLKEAVDPDGAVRMARNLSPPATPATTEPRTAKPGADKFSAWALSISALALLVATVALLVALGVLPT